MHRVVGDAKLQPKDRSDPAPRPDLATEAIGLGTTLQEVGKAGELLGSQSPGRARWRAMPQRVWASLAGTFHPLAHGCRADAQRLGNLALRPAFLLEAPGLESSSFFPVLGYGLHTWQCTKSVPLD
jgi:hypothetical protein